MNDTQRKVVISALVDALQERGSWAGETHVQKNTYFLEELLEVPLGYEFILYKHGPFSFELRDELGGMTADSLLAVERRPYPYGPSLITTDVAASVEERFPKTIAKYEPAITFVADRLGDKGVVELEQLSTALYVTRELGEGSSVNDRAKLLVGYKPHVSLDAAQAAVRTVDEIIAAAPAAA